MFDHLLAELERAAAAVVAACLGSGAGATGAGGAVPVGEVVRRLQAVQDITAAAQGAELAALERTKSYEDDGASTLASWARRELHLTPAEALTMTAAGRTLRVLPGVAASARAGRIRMAHLEKFTYGLKHVGVEAMLDRQDELVADAEASDPRTFFGIVRALREEVYPDSLDEAWVRGMDRRDVRVDPVPDGWHVSGFLDTITGARFHEVLSCLSAPRDGDDTPASQRRVTALDGLLRGYLEHGLPTDKGIRPQLRVIVDHHTLSTQTDGADGPVSPAVLSGFGPIGPQLLSMLACDADITAVGVEDTATARDVLAVGRRHRYATPAQRTAIAVRQDDMCAAPGCTNTHLEIHHVTWWSHGGKTDLANLVGLCTRCHHLVHRALLTIAANPDGGYTFSRRTGRPLDDHHTRARQHRRRQQRLARHHGDSGATCGRGGTCGLNPNRVHGATVVAASTMTAPAEPVPPDPPTWQRQPTTAPPRRAPISPQPAYVDSRPPRAPLRT